MEKNLNFWILKKKRLYNIGFFSMKGKRDISEELLNVCDIL
jgi:hypothetical protein